MAFLNNGTNLLKGTGKMALWGLGIYVGLRVVLPVVVAVAKPLVVQAGRGLMGLRDRLQGGEQGEPREEMSTIAGEEIVAVAETATETSPAVAGYFGEQAAKTKKTTAPKIKVKTKPRRPAAEPSSVAKPMEKWSKADLYTKAKELKIAGRSVMDRNELLAALSGAMAS